MLALDYGFRIYNPAVGRFLSVDPLTRSYPMLTPYQFASNTPIQAIDLDGLEAHTVTFSHVFKGKKPIMTITFDPYKPNPGGVYVNHDYFNDEGFIGSTASGTANYSEFPELFPNEGNYWREDGKPWITFEGHAKLIYGEVALAVPSPVGKFGFEFGIEGTAIGTEYINKGYNAGFTTVGQANSDLNVGAGLSLGGIGLEYRHLADFQGFKEESYVTLTGGSVLEYEFRGDKTSYRIGAPSIKMALGLGFDIGAFMSINPQPDLTDYEKKEKEYMDLLPKSNENTSTGSP